MTVGSVFAVFYIFLEKKGGKSLQIRINCFGLVLSRFGDISEGKMVANSNNT